LYEAARFKLLDLDRGDTLSRLSRSSPAALSRSCFEAFDMKYPQKPDNHQISCPRDQGAFQSSRLAEFGGHGMSFNICRGTLGSLAMLAA
jgi:hypothetical protein